MKKIGILFGQEHSFPPAFVERVNQKTGGHDIVAEFVKIDKVIQGEPCGYDVVIDRISQDVPFYRAWLKRSEEHTSELQSPCNLVCRLLLEKKKKQTCEIRLDRINKRRTRDTE